MTPDERHRLIRTLSIEHNLCLTRAAALAKRIDQLERGEEDGNE